MQEMCESSGSVPEEALRLAFSDLWIGFDPHENFLWSVLSSRWRIELDDSAELLLHGHGHNGRRHIHSRATKVLCCGEPFTLPARLTYDYSLSWHLSDDERHVRVPQGIWKLLTYPERVEAFAARSFEEWTERPYFCNFVYSNAGPPERREFFAALSRRRFVHSPGAVETNTSPIPGGRDATDWWQRKLAYQRRFRFTVAFENSALPGYTSEKAVDALLAGTIPIYWGNPQIALDIDPGSFLDARAFRSWDELAERIVELDDNRELARPFFEKPLPLVIGLGQTSDAIVALIERARTDRRRAARALRTLRPWLFDAVEARRWAAQGIRRGR